MARSPDLLAIETSSRRGSIALRLDDRLVMAELVAGRAHASDLLPLLQGLLVELEYEAVSLPPLDGILVGIGPGSYTGLRVGIATAIGLGRGGAIPVRGVPSFQALAFAELEPSEEGAVALDARAGKFYFARYRREQDDVVEEIAPCLVSAGELAERLAQERIVLGEERLAEAAALAPDVAARVRTNVVARADALLLLGARRLASLGPQAANEIEPLYLRAFGE